ncbi:CinA family nicotinamide mononucleotide deamidase-related protein, partial [Alistipes sp. OttesenSCG-928-L06]|nr:CinA family nicotinamide mononucleotide deamidase-related protein [Alistipes sp. OttesenSCG-928-L06]
VLQITSVRDDRTAIKEAFDEAFGRADLVLVTGGLGPTKDDITKHTLAEYFHTTLVRDRATYDYLDEMLRSKGMRFNELNQAQADVPAGCTVLPNRNGTAPGMWFERDGKVLVSMPGVPFEMKALMTDEVLPRLKSHFRLDQIVHKTAITYGIPESELAIRLETWEDALPPYLKLAYLPNPHNIRLRLSAYSGDGESVAAEIDRQFARLQEIIPANFLGFETASLEEAVAAILLERGETLSVAESCTGGAVASRFTAMAGASGYFLGGVVAYCNDVKRNVLGVSAEDLEKHGAVSETVARQMAEGVRRLTGSTYALSTTGIAGPDGGTPEKPVGTVWMALATPRETITLHRLFGNLRDTNIQRATATVIDLLRTELRK